MRSIAPRLKELQIEGYRSIKDPISISFPENMPVLLVGENNAGKSNIVKALNLLFGERWPGTIDPDDNVFWDRDSSNVIKINAQVEDLSDERGRVIQAISWEYDSTSDEAPAYQAHRPHDSYPYLKSKTREKLICMEISAQRNLSYELSYRSKGTLLSKLMKKFHKSLTKDPTIVNHLKKQFEEIKTIFNEVQEFSNFRDNLSNYFSKMFSTMTYALEIDFSAYDPSNYFHSLRVQPTENREVRTFEELGTGQEQLLALVFAQSYAEAFYDERIILVIEEPEVHLHPMAQSWLSRRIKKMSQSGLQIVMTTHSPAFINLLNLNGHVLVEKIDKATSIKQIDNKYLTEFCLEHGAHEQKTSAESILPFYSASATYETLSGFFARKIVLVEGQTESLALPEYFLKMGLDVDRESIAILPVLGKGNLAKWWRLYSAYKLPVYIIFDNDSKKDKDGKRRRDALKAIGLPKEEIEEALLVENWIIKERFCVFGKDFEHSLREALPEYEKLENEAVEHVGDSKPIKARYVARKLEKDDSQGWQKMEQLKESIEGLSLPENLEISKAKHLEEDDKFESKEDPFADEEDYDEVPF